MEIGKKFKPFSRQPHIDYGLFDIEFFGRPLVNIQSSILISKEVSELQRFKS